MLTSAVDATHRHHEHDHHHQRSDDSMTAEHSRETGVISPSPDPLLSSLTLPLCLSASRRCRGPPWLCVGIIPKTGRCRMGRVITLHGLLLPLSSPPQTEGSSCTVSLHAAHMVLEYDLWNHISEAANLDYSYSENHLNRQYMNTFKTYTEDLINLTNIFSFSTLCPLSLSHSHSTPV